MNSDLSEHEFFKMAFNSGIACLTQLTQKYSGAELQAVLNAAHTISTGELSEVLGKPAEDVALFIQEYIQPTQDKIDAVT